MKLKSVSLLSRTPSRKSIDFLGRWIVNLFLPSHDVCEDEFVDEFCYLLCYLPYSYQPYFKVQSRSLGFHTKICTDHHYAVLRLGCSRQLSSRDSQQLCYVIAHLVSKWIRKVSSQSDLLRFPHSPTQFLDKEENGDNRRLPSGLRLSFTKMWS